MSGTLLEQWRDVAYDQKAGAQNLQRFWDEYFQIEKEIYEKLLANPDEEVKGTVKELLGGLPRIRLLPPLEVTDLHNLMAKCFLVLTDSGGLQEEGPSFRKPVLVMRTETERPEAVEAGGVRVVGVEEEGIYQAVSGLLNSPEEYASFLRNPNPYGDGNASRRILDALARENQF